MNNLKYTQLSNGIKVISEKINHVNSFSLGFWFNIGSRDENKRNNGISHFLEHMFFKGTKKRSAKKISDDIESHGGYLNAFTSKEHTCFYGRGLKNNLKITFEVLSDMVQNSNFNEVEVAKESKVVLDELNDIEDSPEEIIFDKFESNIFQYNPLSFPIIGTEKNIKRFTHDDLINHVYKNYGINNFYIVASGAVEHEDLLKYTDKYFSNFLSTKIKNRKYFLGNNPSDLYFFKDINQSHMIIGTSTFGYKDKERAIIILISNILGEGSSSRLFQSMREKSGIAYQINSFMNSFYDTSTFGVYFSTNDKSVIKARKIVEKEFEKLRTQEVTKKELDRAKEYIRGNLEMSLESTSNRMFRIGNSILYHNRVKSVEESISEFESVTHYDVIEHAQKLLNPENFTHVLIGSRNSFNK